MTWHHSVIARVRALFGSGQLDRDFDVEVQAHLTMLAERFVEQGIPGDEAWSAARRQFGNCTLLKDVRRETSSFTSLETFWQDCRYGVRALMRSRGLSTAIILTLMFGIGANTTLFSVVYAALLKPLPYRDPNRLVFLTEKWSSGGNMVSAADLEYWRGQARSFEVMAGFSAFDTDLNVDGEAVIVRAVSFSGGLESIFGVSTALGRGFLPEEGELRASRQPRHVALISDHLFRQHFGGIRRSWARTFRWQRQAF